MFLGRVVPDDEPEWLPEDRDLVDMYLAEHRSRNVCGHFLWQEKDIEGLELGYRACAICAVQKPYEEKIRKQNRDRGKDEHGLTFGWFIPRGDDIGD